MHQPRGRWFLNWKKPGQKVKSSRFQKKKMVTIVIKRNGKFFVDLHPTRQTFNTKYFTTMILPQIEKLAFPNGHHKGDKKALVHFDNARTHKSRESQKVFADYPF